MPVGHTEDMGARTQVEELKQRSAVTLERAADSTWLERLARGGLVARGVVYVVVGLLAVQIARGDRQERADKQGALQAVVRQPLGRVLVLGLAIGFAGYALWRLIEAAVGPGDEDDARKAMAKRVGYAARGLLYAGFSWTAAKMFVRSTNGASNSNPQADWTARVLGWPGGRLLVAAVGVAVVAGGVYLGWRGLSRTFRKRLKSAQMSPAERRWILRFGAAGMVARMVVSVLIGVFLIAAAVQHRPDESVGIDGALKALADRSFGPALLVVVAFGLVAYGLYSFAEARYRRVGSS
jgi:fumarate reductase subunit D